MVVWLEAGGKVIKVKTANGVMALIFDSTLKLHSIIYFGIKQSQVRSIEGDTFCMGAVQIIWGQYDL
jgi:hypothetical protein